MKYIIVEVEDNKAEALLKHLQNLAYHPASSVVSARMQDEGF